MFLVKIRGCCNDLGREQLRVYSSYVCFNVRVSPRGEIHHDIQIIQSICHKQLYLNGNEYKMHTSVVRPSTETRKL